jgi:uncharacterized protein (TIGR02147 family)
MVATDSASGCGIAGTGRVPSGTICGVSEIVDTLDYRDLLQNAYEQRKADNPLYSYRLMAKKLGLNVSHLYRILHKDLHLALDKVPATCDLLRLQGREAEHFELLVQFGRARSERTRSVLMGKILDLREPKRRAVAHAQFKALSRWQAPVIRALALSGESDPARMGRRLRPVQKTDMVRQILSDLESAGLLKKDPHGSWISSDPHLTTGTAFRSEAVRHYQREVLDLAAAAIRDIPRDQRDITSLVVEVDEEARLEIVEMVRECRRQIVRRIERCANPDQILQLAFAAFPVAAQEEGKP